MKVIGIIAEYNPFHNGHKYQIEQLRQKTGADYVIIAMSGDFLQRGVPALCDKYHRARMALSSGADLVLELPAIWATASAEYFAKGGVSLLRNTGVVTHLGFGAETNDLDALYTLSSILKEEPDEYKRLLSKELKKGFPFPVARKNALLCVCRSFISTTELDVLLDTPNNILALEYLKALPDSISPVLIQRKGAGYHDTDIRTTLPSASAIRDTIFSTCEEITEHLANDTLLQGAVPEEVHRILTPLIENNQFLHPEDFADILGYRLLSLKKDGYQEFADCIPELSNKISNLLQEYLGWDAFCQALKSKDITYTRLSRCLLHILLDIKHQDYVLAQHIGYSPYLRILGFRKDATPLLNAIKSKATVPLISKVADASSILKPEAYAIFEKDIYASDIYNQVLSRKSGQIMKNDYSTPIAIME